MKTMFVFVINRINIVLFVLVDLFLDNIMRKNYQKFSKFT